MTLDVRRVQVWSGEIADRPGSAAATLEMLSLAGTDLALIFTRPHPLKAATAILFLAPISGAQQVQAAREAGLGPALDVFMLVIEGRQRPRVALEVMAKLAIAGINLRGFSVSTAGLRFSAHLAFDDLEDLTRAVQILATLDD